MPLSKDQKTLIALIKTILSARDSRKFAAEQNIFEKRSKELEKNKGDDSEYQKAKDALSAERKAHVEKGSQRMEELEKRFIALCDNDKDYGSDLEEKIGNPPAGIFKGITHIHPLLSEEGPFEHIEDEEKIDTTPYDKLIEEVLEKAGSTLDPQTKEALVKLIDQTKAQQSATSSLGGAITKEVQTQIDKITDTMVSVFASRCTEIMHSMLATNLQRHKMLDETDYENLVSTVDSLLKGRVDYSIIHKQLKTFCGTHNILEVLSEELGKDEHQDPSKITQTLLSIHDALENMHKLRTDKAQREQENELVRQQNSIVGFHFRIQAELDKVDEMLKVAPDKSCIPVLKAKVLHELFNQLQAIDPLTEAVYGPEQQEVQEMGSEQISFSHPSLLYKTEDRIADELRKAEQKLQREIAEKKPLLESEDPDKIEKMKEALERINCLRSPDPVGARTQIASKELKQLITSTSRPVAFSLLSVVSAAALYSLQQPIANCISTIAKQTGQAIPTWATLKTAASGAGKTAALGAATVVSTKLVDKISQPIVQQIKDTGQRISTKMKELQGKPSDRFFGTKRNGDTDNSPDKDHDQAPGKTSS